MSAFASLESYSRITTDSGREGVLVLEFSNPSYTSNNKFSIWKQHPNKLVAKPMTASELFASVLSQEIIPEFEKNFKHSFQTPNILVIKKEDELTKQLISTLEELAIKNNKQYDVSSFARFASRVFLMIMEFVEGVRLSELDISKLSSKQKDDAFHKFGLLISFDLLINNWDRFPIEGVWTNKGNATNIILKTNEDSSQIFAIDHTFTIITQPKLRIQYSSKVKEFIQNILQGDYKQLEVIGKLLNDSIKWEIGMEGFSKIAQGIKDGLQVIKNVDIEQLIKKSLEKAAPLLGDPQDLESSVMIATFMLEIDLECIRVFHKSIKDAFVQ